MTLLSAEAVPHGRFLLRVLDECADALSAYSPDAPERQTQRHLAGRVARHCDRALAGLLLGPEEDRTVHDELFDALVLVEQLDGAATHGERLDGSARALVLSIGVIKDEALARMTELIVRDDSPRAQAARCCACAGQTVTAIGVWNSQGDPEWLVHYAADARRYLHYAQRLLDRPQPE